MYSKSVDVIASMTANLTGGGISISRSWRNTRSFIRRWPSRYARTSALTGTPCCARRRAYSSAAVGASTRSTVMSYRKAFRQGFDISFDAGAEQFDDLRVPAQLRDILLERAPDDRRRLGKSVDQPSRGLGDVAAHVHLFVGTCITHSMTVDPAVPDSGRFALPRRCLRATTAAVIFGRSRRCGLPCALPSVAPFVSNTAIERTSDELDT